MNRWSRALVQHAKQKRAARRCFLQLKDFLRKRPVRKFSFVDMGLSSGELLTFVSSLEDCCRHFLIYCDDFNLEVVEREQSCRKFEKFADEQNTDIKEKTILNKNRSDEHGLCSPIGPDVELTMQKRREKHCKRLPEELSKRIPADEEVILYLDCNGLEFAILEELFRSVLATNLKMIIVKWNCGMYGLKNEAKYLVKKNSIKLRAYSMDVKILDR